MLNRMTLIHDDYKKQRTFHLYEFMLQFLNQNQFVTFMFMLKSVLHAIIHLNMFNSTTQHATALSANISDM